MWIVEKIWYKVSDGASFDGVAVTEPMSQKEASSELDCIINGGSNSVEVEYCGIACVIKYKLSKVR